MESMLNLRASFFNSEETQTATVLFLLQDKVRDSLYKCDIPTLSIYFYWLESVGPAEF